jgi:glutaminyl-tRNA synthetase
MEDNTALDKKKHFIRQTIEADLASGKHTQITTRFPPEPNGYLHIGHAKSICLNFGMAEEFNGQCNLRLDDTNPAKEDQEYIDAIKNDVHWLGFQWAGDVRFASGYFNIFYQKAIQLIELGKAYVCSLNAQEMRTYRGTLTEPGKESPYRNRSIAENLSLFDRMKKGEFQEGEHVLRAKIDMSAPNINLRDPVIYRIKHLSHHQTGDDWCIYPMYDYAHCISDAAEGITHSLCTLEFEDHRPLYDWILDTLNFQCHPQQIEFSRLNVNYTITSKRKLKQLVDTQVVSGWDDPRMPTIVGLRRRGYPAPAIRAFCEAVGVTKSEAVIEMDMLEYFVRDELDKNAPRAMCVFQPLKVVIENYPAEKEEILSCANHPKKAELGTRQLPFHREIYIDQNDFMEHPPKDYHRLTIGKEVRLRHSYVIRAERVIKNDQGEILEVRCSYDEQTLGKNPEGRKVKGVIHWVSARAGIPCTVRLYQRLFTLADPESDTEKEFTDFINPDSMNIITTAIAEASLAEATPESAFQFEREGYFCADRWEHQPKDTLQRLVFNQTVSLKDSWGKAQ